MPTAVKFSSDQNQEPGTQLKSSSDKSWEPETPLRLFIGGVRTQILGPAPAGS